MAKLAATTPGAQDKENRKLPTDDQSETLSFVFLVLDCTFAVAFENTAQFC